MENVWYRLEVMVQRIENAQATIRVYKENETVPVTGSTLAGSFPVINTERKDDGLYRSTFYMHSAYLYSNANLIQDPETDLEPFAWYLDDIRIGYDEDETLMVGF